MALKWQDRREVIMLSTLHKPRMVQTKKSDWKTQQIIKKPECVVDYNQNMGAVDKTYMQISFVESVRKTVKWYKKVFFHLMDLSILNAHILFKLKHSKTIPFGDFRIQLIREIIERYGQPKGPTGRPTIGDNPIRLTARHFPSLVPSTLTRKAAQRYCVVCSPYKQTGEKAY